VCFITEIFGASEEAFCPAGGYQLHTMSSELRGIQALRILQALLTNIDAINETTTRVIGWPIYGYWHFNNKPEAAAVMETADVSF
jgi:hypothetical protein